MRASVPLSALRQRLQDSSARLQAIQDCMPSALAAHVKAGPVDDGGWSLLAANAAVAAKLRQLEPRLQQRLKDQGWQMTVIRIKVQSF